MEREMRHPTIQELERIAAETRYREDAIEKMIRLFDILQAIADDEFLAPRLALRGGTALNTFYFELPRLSVDIDIDYIGARDVEEMLRERPMVDAALLRILDAQGFSTKRIASDIVRDRLTMRFPSAVLPHPGKAAIDLSYLSGPPLFDAVRLTSFPLGDRRARNILVLDLQEVIAGKLAALFQRTKARDLFDAENILDMDGFEDLDWKGIKASFIVSCVGGRGLWRNTEIDVPPRDPLKECQRVMQLLRRRHFSDNAAALAWRAGAVAASREGFAFMPALSESEQAFVDGFEVHGEIDPSLLPASPEMRARVGVYLALAFQRRVTLEQGSKRERVAHREAARRARSERKPAAPAQGL